MSIFVSTFIAMATLAASPEGGVNIVARDLQTIVVVPEDAQPITVYAAQELIGHVALSTGVTLEQYAEGEVPDSAAPRIYLGPTKAATEAGIEVATLPEETFVLRTVDGNLFIAAADGPGDPLSTGTTASGVLWGVYEVLERDLGARWLWPGALGTVAPTQATLTVGPYDEVIPPRFQQRHLRPSIGPHGFATADPRLAFTEAQRAQYAHDQSVFLRRHRMGQSAHTYFSERKFGSGHSFGHWWERYGEEHPEWFQLLPDGRRGPDNPEKPDNVSMCASNPGLQAKIVELWAEERAKYPGEPLGLGVGENDGNAACVCDACLALDPPLPDPSTLPEGLERSYEPVQAGTRYAHLLKAVHGMASEIDPGVHVHFYAYLNYFWPPAEGFTLDPNVMIGFVPWFRWAGWFPRTEDEQAWIKQQWLGWKRTGATLYYRPNWFLDGYTMPHVYMHQFAGAFQFYAKNGMVATDFDSLQGMWAAQGPNLYLLARIHVRPEAPVDELLDEYYAAFGPAKDAVRGYFDHWEQYSVDNRARAAQAIQTRRDGHFRRYALYAAVADELYPPEVFDAGFALLDKAQEAAAKGESIHAERVAFLRAGLEHARRCVETAVVMNAPASTPEERAAALGALRDYRRCVAPLGIANMDRAGIIETDSWQEVPGFKDAWPERTQPLFRDTALDEGFNLSTVRSTMKPLVQGSVLAKVPEPDPQWRLAQWGTRFDLWGAAVDTRDDGVRTLANEGKQVRVYPGGLGGAGLELAVNGGAEYGGHLRQNGEAWPHLLIEQSFPGGLHLADFGALRLQFTFRIGEVKPAVDAPLDPGLHTAHINAFFTLNNLNAESPGYRDMIWFGIPLYDVRHGIPRGHQAIDGGKDDASGKFICTIEGARFWDTPTGDGAWHTFDHDLLPLMREALAITQKAGYCTHSNLEDMAATTFNIGWEVPGPYDCAAQLKGLALEGVR